MQSKPEKGNAPEVAATEASSVKNPAIKQGFNMSNSTVVTTNPAIATPDLTIVAGKITTTSNQIAEHFGKRHDVVLRAVRNLECSENFRLHNFAESSYTNEQGKKMPCYRITRDGFSFLAMGFTGKEAAQWKEAYITAFNKMEAELRGKTAEASPAIDYTRISPAQKQDLREIVQVIVDAGIQKYGETWARFQRKFRINSYEALPAERYEEARQYLIAKLPAGYAGEIVEETPLQNLNDAERVELAFSMSATVTAQVSRCVFGTVMSGQEWRGRRFLVSLGYDQKTGKQIAPIAQVMEHSEMVTSLEKLPDWINGHDPIFATDEQLANIATACTQRLARSAANRRPSIGH